VTFITDFIRREAEAIVPELADISHTVPYAFDIPPLPTAHQREVARRALQLPKDVPLIGNAGWLIERKRFDVFLKVAARVSAEHPEAMFVIAGDGPARPMLERMAAELKIADRVIWLSWQRGLEAFFLAIDVLLFNSDADALGRTPLEALSYGVPIVASVLYGGLAEVVDRDDYGFLLDTHDVGGLADRLNCLLSNPDLAVRMATAGRSRVAEVGSPGMHTARMRQILQL
jgi:glycosyltransferase involved in cell wall biosynthesis